MYDQSKRENDGGLSDDDVIKQYKPDMENEAADCDTSDGEHTGGAQDGAASDGEKKRVFGKGMARHLYPCPHCGELILDTFTECPKCGGKVEPKGYNTDEEKRAKIVRICGIVGAVVSVVAVVLCAVFM